MWKFLLGSYVRAAPVTLGVSDFSVWFCKPFYSFPWSGAELFPAFPVPLFPTSHLSLPSTGTLWLFCVDSKSQQNSQILLPPSPQDHLSLGAVAPFFLRIVNGLASLLVAALIWEFRYPKKAKVKVS